MLVVYFLIQNETVTLICGISPFVMKLFYNNSQLNSLMFSDTHYSHCYCVDKLTLLSLVGLVIWFCMFSFLNILDFLWFDSGNCCLL